LTKKKKFYGIGPSLVGTFKDERLVSVKSSKVESISFNENQVLVLHPGPNAINVFTGVAYSAPK